MSNRWAREARSFLICAWLIAGCSDTGGPAPEVPSPFAGNGGMGGSGGGGLGGAAGIVEGGTGGMLAGGAGGAGAFGGSGGLGGTGGSAGDVAAGVGGMSGAAGTGHHPGTCTDSDALADQNVFDTSGFDDGQALVKGTTVGTNGAFEDSCNASGDLLEHVCEVQLTCGFDSSSAEGACAPSPQRTGRAAPQLISCFGLCRDGVCNVPCLEVDDELAVVNVAGDRVELHASAAGVRYACARAVCLAFPPEPGDMLSVVTAPAPGEAQLDCRAPFATAVAPLELSDGCDYTDCTAIGPAAP